MKSIKFLKKILLLFILLFQSLQIFSLSELNLEEREFIRRSQEFVFTGQTFYPPFEFFNKTHNEYTGMTVELVRWIAAEFGFKARFIHTHFKEAQELVLNNRADVLTSLFFSRERRKKFDFTSVIFNVPASIFVRAERTDIKDIYSLTKKTIAIQAGDYAIEFLKFKNIHCKITLTKNFAEAVDLVIQGKSDAAIGDEQIVMYHLYSNNLNNYIKRIGSPLYTGLNCMAVKDNRRILLEILNKGIERARVTGILDKIVYKWLGMQYQKSLNPFVKYWSLISALVIFFLLLFLIFWFWNFNLKKQVNSRTDELQKELTERKIAEESLHKEVQIQKALLSSTPAMIFLKDRDLCYSAVNKAFCERVNLPEGYLIGKTDYEIFPEGIAEKKMNVEKQVIENDIPLFNREEPIEEGKNTRWLLWTYVPYHDTSGSVLGLVGIALDITERKLYEQERDILINDQKEAIISVKLAQEQMTIAQKELEKNNIELEDALCKAEESNRLKSEFLAIMSHELRTPLAGMLGFSEILTQDETLNIKQKHYVESIFRSGKRLLAVLSDLLEISVIEAGKINIETMDFMVSDVVTDVYILLKEEMDKKNIHFTQNYNNVNTIRSDPSRIRQILLNLIGNAIKFTDKGTISIEIFKNDNEYEFHIKDTGIGIKEENINVIFDMFRQVEDPNRRKYQGTGLGLAICKRLVEAIGGKIWVKSEYGAGSDFAFSIPAVVTAILKDPQLNNSYEPVSKKQKVRVFFAEDDEINYELIWDFFSTNTNIEIEGFKNGNELLLRISSSPLPDVIFLDIEMPVLSGLECLDEIRKINKKIPVIALTAYAMKSDREKFITKGFTDFITKPVDRENLLELVDKYTQSLK